jgi:hypothetical protein
MGSPLAHTILSLTMSAIRFVDDRVEMRDLFARPAPDRLHARHDVVVGRLRLVFARMEKLNGLLGHVSTRVEGVDAQQNIGALSPWIYEMVANGLVEVQDTEFLENSQRRS